MRNIGKWFGVAGAVAACAGAWTQTTLYGGSDAAEMGYQFLPWGDGTAAQTKETTRVGGYSVKIGAKGPYQGGVLAFANPVDVSSKLSDPNNLLVFMISIPALGTSGYGGSTGSAALRVRNLRIVIGTDDGKLTEFRFDVLSRYHAYDPWHAYSIPLSKIPRLDSTSKRVSKIGFFADAPVTFYIGEINIISDETPIEGSIVEMNTNLARNDEPLFVAAGTGGNTALKYYWDWNASDGVQKETEGAAVYHMFRVPGEYTVTLTIEDAYGIKKPFTATIKITVNP